jgi:hypothetical protein
MNNTITEENLILFIYNEADEILKARINSALFTDNSLREKFRLIKSSINNLEADWFSPDDTSVKIILEASALTQGEEIC